MSEVIGSELFSVETVRLDNGHTLSAVAVESKAHFIGDLPDGWQSRLDDEIESAGLVVPEYFPPELVTTSHNGRLLGNISALYAAKHHSVYDHVAESAASAGKPVAVFDPASRPSFLLYNSVLPVATMHLVSSLRDVGISGRQPDIAERLVPTGTDARRMITAAGLRQALRSEESVTYIGAPAHVRRILGYLTMPPTTLDTMRYAAYKRTMSRFMYARWYEHDQAAGWQLIDKAPIE